NSLGQHTRNQGAGYANLNLTALRRFSLSLGARDEILTGAVTGTDNVFSPSIAAAYTLTRTVRLRASAGHGFRLPTYVDLYYSDPTTIGNPNLKPESSWSYELGAEWTPTNRRLTLNAAAFRLQEKKAIDYAKTILATPALTFAEPWQAINIQNLNITGAEATVRLRLTNTQQLQFSYTAAHAAPPPPNLLSEYAYNYAAQNALFLWTCTFRQVTAHTQVNIVQKTQHTAYPLWDIALSRNTGHLRPYLRAMNLSNTSYQEIPQVPLQGRTIMAGAAFNWSSARH
ncbi:MAG TPA: TonB-dependent receptor, partial [Edaphobacter sp.]|nr:TonB-dependent receptor [Edaphobacter sp.]